MPILRISSIGTIQTAISPPLAHFVSAQHAPPTPSGRLCVHTSVQAAAADRGLAATLRRKKKPFLEI